MVSGMCRRQSAAWKVTTRVHAMKPSRLAEPMHDTGIRYTWRLY